MQRHCIRVVTVRSGVLKRVYAYVCPTCGNACLEKYMNERQNTMFCWNCGQKLDWSEENE